LRSSLAFIASLTAVLISSRSIGVSFAVVQPVYGIGIAS
jgi:hypothetical protein